MSSPSSEDWLDLTGADRARCRLNARARAKTHARAFDMTPDGRYADAKLARHFRIGQTAGAQFKTLTLAPAQLGEMRRDRSAQLRGAMMDDDVCELSRPRRRPRACRARPRPASPRPSSDEWTPRCGFVRSGGPTSLASFRIRRWRHDNGWRNSGSVQTKSAPPDSAARKTGSTR